MHLIKLLRSNLFINRTLAWLLKLTHNPKITSRWPLKGIVKIKVAGHKIKFYSDCDDFLVSNLFYGFDAEELSEVNFLLKEKFVVDGQAILDIGSYNGLFSLAFAKTYPKNKVIAFEPNPVNAERIKKNLEINRINNIDLRILGVSDSLAKLDFFIQSDNKMTTVSSFSHQFTLNHTKGNIDKITVDTVTLDQFCHQNNVKPGFLKIDVEGHELNVFKGGEQIINKYQPVILCELFTKKYNTMEDYQNSESIAWQIEQILSKSKYQYYALENGKLKRFYSLSVEKSNRNFVFLPNHTLDSFSTSIK